MIGIVLGACSPKIVPTQRPVAQPVTEVPKVVKPVAPKVSNIALILPFDLDRLDLSANATKSGLSKADIAAEYYQGFKLALDSLTAKGYNFKLSVFDSKGEASETRTLAYNPKIRSSDLIVGPVYPEGIKTFTSMLSGVYKPIVSPLSPAPPAQFKTANLVTVTPPLAYHALRVARYIRDYIKPVKVFVLRSGNVEDDKYIIPFARSMDTLSNKRIRVVEFIVGHGNLDALTPQLSDKNENVFVIPSTDQAFLFATLATLDKLAHSYDVTVFGHPYWASLSFLPPDLLERLKTCITSADKLDNRSAAASNFIKNFRKVYHTEPGEYAFKGFDEGYYFGGLLNAGTFSFRQLGQQNYDGVRNSYNFVRTPGDGWVNQHVDILQYQNAVLKPVE